jgi:hypothetical protein
MPNISMNKDAHKFAPVMLGVGQNMIDFCSMSNIYLFSLRRPHDDASSA